MATPASAVYYKLQENDPQYRYELRTINCTAWPHIPTHPQLHLDTPPCRLEDGTFGDRDYLFTPRPFWQDRVWIHYIPTTGMWPERLPGYHFNEVPIHIKPTMESRFWRVSSDGIQGRFTRALYDDLQKFFLDGLTHAERLSASAKEYRSLPGDPNHLDWWTLLGTGPFSSMMAHFVDMQRNVAELYGWIFLQEKLQPSAVSIVPHRRTTRYQSGIAPIDHFVGVIVPWKDRLEWFDDLALKHGVSLWWCDYAEPGTSDMPAWVGAPDRQPEPVGFHQGAGFIPIADDPGTRTVFVSYGASESAPRRGGGPRHDRPQKLKSLLQRIGDRATRTPQCQQPTSGRPKRHFPNANGTNSTTANVARVATDRRGQASGGERSSFRKGASASVEESKALRMKGGPKRKEGKRAAPAKARPAAKALRRAKKKSKEESDVGLAEPEACVEDSQPFDSPDS